LIAGQIIAERMVATSIADRRGVTTTKATEGNDYEREYETGC
jgi:hypothetical protein